MKNYIILVSSIFLTLMPLIAQSQNTSLHSLGFGYFGEKVTHPGIQLSYQSYPNWINFKKNKFEWGGNMSVYIHNRSHVGLRITPNIGYRILHFKKNYILLKTDVGFFRRYYQGKVYTIDDNGIVSYKKSFATPHFTYGIYTSFRRKLFYQTNFIGNIYLDMGFFKETKVIDHKGITHPYINFGFIKNLNYVK